MRSLRNIVDALRGYAFMIDDAKIDDMRDATETNNQEASLRDEMMREKYLTEFSSEWGQSFSADEDSCYVCGREVSYGADTGECDECGVVFHYPNCDRGAGHSDDPMSHYCSNCSKSIVWGEAESFSAEENLKGAWHRKTIDGVSLVRNQGLGGSIYKAEYKGITATIWYQGQYRYSPCWRYWVRNWNAIEDRMDSLWNEGCYKNGMEAVKGFKKDVDSGKIIIDVKSSKYKQQFGMSAESFSAEGDEGWLDDETIVWRYYTQWFNGVGEDEFFEYTGAWKPLQALESLSPEMLKLIADEQRESVGSYDWEWRSEPYYVWKQRKEKSAESFSAEGKCYKCGVSENKQKLWWAGKKGLVCGTCSEGGVKYAAFAVDAYDEKITVWICHACNRRYEDQNDAEACCEGLKEEEIPYFDGRSKEVREVHLHDAESFKDWADEEERDHGNISFDDWAEQEYEEPAHKHHLLLSFQEWADEEKRESAHKHSESSDDEEYVDIYGEISDADVDGSSAHLYGTIVYEGKQLDFEAFAMCEYDEDGPAGYDIMWEDAEIMPNDGWFTYEQDMDIETLDWLGEVPKSWMESWIKDYAAESWDHYVKDKEECPNCGQDVMRETIVSECSTCGWTDEDNKQWGDHESGRFRKFDADTFDPFGEEEYYEDLHLRLILIQGLIEDERNPLYEMFQNEEIWLDEANDDYICLIATASPPTEKEAALLVEYIEQIIAENNFYDSKKGPRDIFLAVQSEFSSEDRDVSERMTREEAEKLAVKVVRMVSPHVDFVEVCGSYRRGREDPGDLDIVIILKEGETLPGIIDKNKKTISQINWMGEKKAQTIIDGRKIDFRTTDTKGKGASLLYFTGPAGYNIGMRRRAKKMGMKLNEYGIWDRDTNEYLGGATEEEIYEVLGKSYKPPNERKGAENYEQFAAEDTGEWLDEEMPAGTYTVEWIGGREEFDWEGGSRWNFNDEWTDIIWEQNQATVWNPERTKKEFGAVALIGSTQKEFNPHYGEPLGPEGW